MTLKITLDSEQIGTQLSVYFAAKGMTQERVAVRYRVSQSWVARIYAGNFTERSRTVDLMCREAGIALGEAGEIVPGVSNKRAELSRLLDSIWNGTPEDARYLMNVLRMLRKLRHDQTPGDGQKGSNRHRQATR